LLKLLLLPLAGTATAGLFHGGSFCAYVNSFVVSQQSVTTMWANQLKA
jgi:hypothetical protein